MQTINETSVITMKPDWLEDACPSFPSSRCDPRLSLGRLYLLPECGGPSGAEDVGAGHPAGPPPRAGPRLWSHGGRSVRQLLWYDPTDHKWKNGSFMEVLRLQDVIPVLRMFVSQVLQRRSEGSAWPPSSSSSSSPSSSTAVERRRRKVGTLPLYKPTAYL